MRWGKRVAWLNDDGWGMRWLTLFDPMNEQELARRVHKWQTLVSLALARWTGRPFLPVSYSEVGEPHRQRVHVHLSTHTPLIPHHTMSTNNPLGLMDRPP